MTAPGPMRFLIAVAVVTSLVLLVLPFTYRLYDTVLRPTAAASPPYLVLASGSTAQFYHRTSVDLCERINARILALDTNAPDWDTATRCVVEPTNGSAENASLLLADRSVIDAGLMQNDVFVKNGGEDGLLHAIKETSPGSDTPLAVINEALFVFVRDAYYATAVTDLRIKPDALIDDEADQLNFAHPPRIDTGKEKSGTRQMADAVLNALNVPFTQSPFVLDPERQVEALCKGDIDVAMNVVHSRKDYAAITRFAGPANGKCVIRLLSLDLADFPCTAPFSLYDPVMIGLSGIEIRKKVGSFGPTAYMVTTDARLAARPEVLDTLRRTLTDHIRAAPRQRMADAKTATRQCVDHVNPTAQQMKTGHHP